MPIVDLHTGGWVASEAVEVDLEQPVVPDAPVASLHFADFADGRGYSVARMLRRQGFEGRLRATGDSGLDQLFYLKRCGFDEAELTEAEVTLLKPIHLDPIPVRLQPAER